jgi:hypothetical protein
MPRNPNKNQKRQQGTTRATPQGGTSWLHQSTNWPLYAVLLSKDWQETYLTSVLVARQSPRSGKIGAAAFLVDRACLGVKSAFVRICKSPEDYVKRVREPMLKDQDMEDMELDAFDLVAKIITEGLAYAERLGLSPDPEYRQASLLLSGANPAACDVEVPLGGSGGKPLFVPGPYDNMGQVVATLTRTVGPDGFDLDVPPEQRENLVEMLGKSFNFTGAATQPDKGS